MAQNAPLVLTDSSAVSKTFDPSIKDGLMASWRLNDSAVAVALRKMIKASFKPQRGKERARTTVEVLVPFERVVDGITQPREYISLTLDAKIPSTAALADVQDAEAFMVAALQDSIITDMVENGSFVY